MQRKHFLALSPDGFHRVAYTQWGDPANPRVLLCVHGLTRNSRDFDDLARALESEYRVVCPDIVGRGQSDWLERKTDYGYAVYCAHMAALIAHLDVEEVDWVGTSMGGLVGMMLAALPGAPERPAGMPWATAAPRTASPIGRLVLNDIGPLISKAGLERIAQYVGKDPVFDTIDALEMTLRVLAASFGPLSDAQWRHMAVHGHYVDQQGKLHLAYDPAIGDPFRNGPLDDIDMWSLWNALRCPVLVIRGANSDLLGAATLAKMKQRPQTTTVELAGIGHAPMLMDPAQIGLIKEFLLGAKAP
jgi:pimeloyl-ACP methyl ester carboxylesterase